MPRVRPQSAEHARRCVGRLAAAVSVAAGLALGADVVAQPAQGDPPLRPVDPGSADVSPLSLSTRVMPIDLRVPLDFDRVYEISRPGSPIEARAARGNAHWFARISGGLWAMFPRSVYRDTPFGAIAEIPPGTVFSIGPPAWLRETPARDDGSLRGAEMRLDLSARTGDPARDVAQTPPLSLWTDERFRARRLDDLLSRALQTHDPALGTR